MISTIVALLLYFGIAFVPKVPWYVKVILQIIMGLVIYFVFKEHSFELPMGDKLPMSSLFGGDAYDLNGGLNKYAFGILGTVLGLLGTAVATVIYALLGKKNADK
ncbi:MAG: hypothetical protein WC314_04780 [Vulcanimicrobiota bacterium]